MVQINDLCKKKSKKSTLKSLFLYYCLCLEIEKDHTPALKKASFWCPFSLKLFKKHFFEF